MSTTTGYVPHHADNRPPTTSMTGHVIHVDNTLVTYEVVNAPTHVKDNGHVTPHRRRQAMPPTSPTSTTPMSPMALSTTATPPTSSPLGHVTKDDDDGYPR